MQNNNKVPKAQQQQTLSSSPHHRYNYYISIVVEKRKKKKMNGKPWGDLHMHTYPLDDHIIYIYIIGHILQFRTGVIQQCNNNKKKNG